MMPTCFCARPNLSRHYRYFEQRALAKGCSRRKAEQWARRQVARGKRAP